MEDKDLLESLRPTSHDRIIDLVERSGINVSDWGITKNGKKVKEPASNPAYCSEWSFGGDKEPILLCVWHKNLQVIRGQVIFEDNLRQRALDIQQAAENKDSSTKATATLQAGRAANFNKLILAAFNKTEPVRVVLLRANSEIESNDEPPKYRELDSENWYVHDYQFATGVFRLVRSVPPKSKDHSVTNDSPLEKFVDQFSIPDLPEKRTATGTVYIRSPEVRKSVLIRASGVCEFCGQPGFKTAAGTIYLETHHVIALAEDGPDVEWNVVAICPNDHRRAHHAENREEVRTQLLAILAKQYPNQPFCKADFSDSAQSSS
ncbi:HNH endonuclease [Methylomonas lenta]|nr:HNH endonuclease signature motif containing protein [Methylomonas lenta]